MRCNSGSIYTADSHRSVFSPSGDCCGDVTSRASFPGVSMVEARFSRATPVPSHRHGYPHLLLVVHGVFRVYVNSRPTELNHGDAIFHEASETHSGQVASSNARGFTVELTHSPNLVHPGTKGSTYGRQTTISRILALLYREANVKDLAQRFAVEGLRLQLVAALMRDRESAATEIPPWLNRAKEFLHDTACQPHTMAELSAAIGVEQKATVRAFRKFLNATPAEYQRSLRLDRARRSVVETRSSIAQIAAENGFCDQAYFTHQFKKAYHCSPGEYRRLFGTTRVISGAV